MFHEMEMRAEMEMQFEKMEVVTWALRVTRNDKIKSECLSGTTNTAKVGDKLGGTRLRLYGHVRRRGLSYMGKRHWRWRCQVGLGLGLGLGEIYRVKWRTTQW